MMIFYANLRHSRLPWGYCIYVGYPAEVDGYWHDSDAWPTHGRGHI